MSIKLPNIKDIANIIKLQYSDDFRNMTMFFCYKIDVNKYCIFQEIQSVPLKRVVYCEKNNSVTFVASWSAWSSPYSYVADANNDKVKNWKDLLDRSRSYNAYKNNISDINHSGYWHTIRKRNKKEKKKKHKDKHDTFIEFKISAIERAYFYKWGFSLYSPILSIISVRNKHLFPYLFDEDNEDNEDNEVSGDNGVNEDYGVDESGHIARIGWSGEVFNIDNLKAQFYNEEPVSFWDKNEYDKDNDNFDDEIANYLLEDRESNKDILDVGQKNINLKFD